MGFTFKKKSPQLRVRDSKVCWYFFSLLFTWYVLVYKSLGMPKIYQQIIFCTKFN
ncbi:hypothetical protein Msm_1082 [Methanobrevibacter smithii ATCC 35061]|uniref:Uncharacterized protein n=1 Tax=Methanobrevibacter smithii (strain ATCC 35061 / DSM 861 / OCM 144 / PS) TaxID=420247 RepID=A5UM59_METS3|nr:hypothetical protein Msm_1082 [Methanobrevibacter smithii ATCC 35061]